MELTGELRERLTGIQRRGLAVGAVALALSGAIGLFAREQFFQSYLLAYLFWLGLSLGSLALLMVQYLTGGRWGVVIQRPAESAVWTLPVMALLFVPLLVGMRDLYVWTHDDVVAADELLQHKQSYLNTGFFVLRAGVYFVIWLGLGFLLQHWSTAPDRRTQAVYTKRLAAISAPGLVLYAVTMSLAAVDWAMSLEPHWHSTIYGPIFLVGQILAALALMIVTLVVLGEQAPLADVLVPRHFHDLGKLLFAFVMLWAYVSFSQYLIVWSGNLPDEITWYVRRTGGAWGSVGLVLVMLHFALPFVLLLFEWTKRNVRWLLWIAALLLLMRMVDVVWLVAPAFHEEGFHVQWLAPLLVVGIGGLWLAVYICQLKRRAVLPEHDPRLELLAEDRAMH